MINKTRGMMEKTLQAEQPKSGNQGALRDDTTANY